jgi:4-hydroxybenzoate polyprenyltransferase
MCRRSLRGIFKANHPQFFAFGFPLAIGGIVFGLDGRPPDWGATILFLITATILESVADFANTYADRDEDRVFVPSNPLVTGELELGTARRAFILQNALGGLFLVALLALTLNYWSTLALAIGWMVGIAYSLPPLRLKETILCPFLFALGITTIIIASWLLVESSLVERSGFILAFGAFLFALCFPLALSLTKLRKTFDALARGYIQVEIGRSVWALKTSGIGLSVRSVVAIEAVVGLGAFILIPIFWHLGIFDMALAISLLTLPLTFMILTVVLRISDPVRNTRKCEQFAGMTLMFSILSFFAVGLTSVLHWNWGFSALACIAIIVWFNLLTRYVHPFGPAYRSMVFGRQN